MLSLGGGRKPSDVFGSAVVEGLWPEDSAIAQIKQVGEKFRDEASRRLERAGELNSAHSGIMNSIQSVNAEAMYDRLAKITRDQNALVDNAMEIYRGAEEMARECGDLQLSLVSVVEAHRPSWDAAIESGIQQIAAVVLATAKAQAAEKAADAASWIGERGARITERMTQITPASWGPGAEAPSTTGGGSADPTIQAVNNEPGRFGEDSASGSATENGQPNSDSTATEAEAEEPSEGKFGADEDRPGGDEAAKDGADSGSGEAPTDNLNEQAGSSGSPGSGSSSGGSGSSSLGGLPSGGGGSGSGGAGGGLGSMGSGLGSPSSLLSESGLGSAGQGPAGAGGLSPAALMGSGAPGAAGAGSGSGGGSGSGSGSGSGGAAGGGVRVPPPVAAPPVSTTWPPQTPAAPVSAAPSAAGGFGQSGMSSVAGAGAPVASGGGMPMGAPMASPAVPPPAVPPPAHPGPAPTASPGLTQGSAAAAPGGTSAGAVGAAGAAGVAAASAAPYSAAVPQRIDHYGQMAVDAVKVLAPAAARLPGLVVAVAVVSSRGGHPQLVMTTNDGAGFMPEGFFLPAGMIHAFADINSPDFDRKWFGWTDPSRTLLDYAVARGQLSGSGLQVLGLASSAQVSGETKEIFPNAVPVVRPDAGAEPVSEDGGRNAHRLKVLAPLLYADLMNASDGAREQAAVMATDRAMALAAAAPLRAAGGPWQIMMSGRALEPAEWETLRGRYSELVGTYGAMRPGFMTGDLVGQLGTGYQSQFQLVRAIEVLLGWESAPSISSRDILYTAHQAGVDINQLLA